MSLAYTLMYALGYTPWEQIAEHPAACLRIEELFAREERGRRPPYGKALDLGCGSGTWAVTLARRGWDVTGVDLVPTALRRARQRASQAKVALRLVRADATDLAPSNLGTGFRLFIDFFLFHDELSDDQRLAMGREVTAIATPDAALLMTAWAPGRRGPLPRGANCGDIEAAYPAWRVIDDEPFDVVTGTPFYRYIHHAHPRVYRLQHQPATRP